MLLDLESVRLFVLAAEFGSLTRAAEVAGTVQPVVSQRLKALEARLGRRLLERTPRFVRPTPDGAMFLVRARALLAGARVGLGVAPMGRVASGGVADVGPALGLPSLPASEIVLFGRTGSPAAASALRALAAGVRASLLGA